MIKCTLFLIIAIFSLNAPLFSQIFSENEVKDELILDSLMPKISGLTLDNINIDSVFFRNNITLIQFSEAGCAPCVFEYKYLNEILNYFAKENFNVLGIYPLNREQLKKYIEDLKMKPSEDPRKLTCSIDIMPEYLLMPECEKLKNIHGCNEISGRYGIKGYPLTVIIDKNCKVRYIHAGFTLNQKIGDTLKEEWIHTIKELLKNETFE